MNTKTSYFTFGQDHVHRVNNQTFDCDTVVKITAINPRERMVEMFGGKWSMEYDRLPDMDFYPKGLVTL